MVDVLTGALGSDLRSDTPNTETLSTLFGSSASSGSSTYNPNVATAVVLPDSTKIGFKYFTMSGSGSTVGEVSTRYDESAPTPESAMIYNDSSGYGPANNLRGNVTDTYRALGSANIQTSGQTYDVGGNVLTSANADTSPGGIPTTYTYNEGSGYFAFPIAIKNALKQVSGLAWDYNAGKH